MPKPSILLLSRTLDTGGSERQLSETAKALHARNWEVHVGCFHDAGARAQELRTAGIPVVRFPVTSFASVSVLRGVSTFVRYVLRHRIALTHSFDMPLNIFGTFAGRLSVRPVVISSQRAYRHLYSKTEQRLLRTTDKFVDGIVVNCEAIRRHLIDDERVAADRVHLCYNGLDTDSFFPAAAPRPEFAAAEGAVVIGTIAVLRPEKSIVTLIEAFAGVRRQYVNSRLLIVGSGEEQQRLQALVHSLGIAPDVHFEPATTQVAEWLNKMDIFVLPSASEALSNSLMEAMACGVAPIASSVGGNPELVRDGETGLLFPAGDVPALTSQLGRLIENDMLRRRLGVAAASFIAREMNISKCASRMAAIYDHLLAR